jgi:hypothetical protein
MKNGKKPISPLYYQDIVGKTPKSEYHSFKDELVGLTKEEYFASKALQGILSNPNLSAFLAKEGVIDEDYLVGLAASLGEKLADEF